MYEIKIRDINGRSGAHEHYKVNSCDFENDRHIVFIDENGKETQILLSIHDRLIITQI